MLRGQFLTFKNQDIPLSRVAPAISTYSMTERKLVIDELQYGFQTYKGVF